MKKYLPWTAVLLLCLSALFYQWLRAEKELDYLHARTDRLEKELAQIDRVRSNFPAFEEEIEKTDNLLGMLQKRLPPEAGEKVFAQELVQRFKKHDIEIVFYYSDSVNKEFYKEINLVFTYKDEDLDESLLEEIFQNMERLVRWEIIEQDRVLLTRIYSSPMDTGVNRITPCKQKKDEPMTYWPFNSSIQEALHQIDKRCSQRTMAEDVFSQIERLTNRQRQMYQLEQIVLHLEQRRQQDKRTLKTPEN